LLNKYRYRTWYSLYNRWRFYLDDWAWMFNLNLLAFTHNINLLRRKHNLNLFVLDDDFWSRGRSLDENWDFLMNDFWRRSWSLIIHWDLSLLNDDFRFDMDRYLNLPADLLTKLNGRKLNTLFSNSCLVYWDFLVHHFFLNNNWVNNHFFY